MKTTSELDLSASQQQIVNASGKFVVRACPGSGKTYALAARLLKDIPSWTQRHSGIAALSFTNAAREELEAQLREFGLGISYPHCVSTIDSFINQYIFLPFARLAVDFAGEVEMIGEPFGQFHSHSHYEVVSTALKYKDGRYWFKGVVVAPAHQGNVIKAKQNLVKKGKFTQADANHYALKILKENPRIARSLAARFPYIIVDEAQDSTPIQWEILEILAAQTRNVCFGLVGDPDQAIYGWNGASQKLFVDHEDQIREEGGTVIILNESRRSSQAICDFYKPLSTLPSVPISINNRLKGRSEHLEVRPYDAIESVPGMIEDILGGCSDGSETFILCRETRLIQAIYAANQMLPVNLTPWGKGTDPVYLANMIFSSRYYYDMGNYHEAYRQMQKAVAILTGRKKEDVVLDWMTWRIWCGELRSHVVALPTTKDKTLGQWVEAANKVVASHKLLNGIKMVAKNKYRDIDYPNLPTHIFFPDDLTKRLAVQTIHRVKGKTADQVILILNEERAKGLLRAYQGKKKIDEDTRTLYVALTRARLKNIILVPASVHGEYQKVFSLSSTDP